MHNPLDCPPTQEGDTRLARSIRPRQIPPLRCTPELGWRAQGPRPARRLARWVEQGRSRFGVVDGRGGVVVGCLVDDGFGFGLLIPRFSHDRCMPGLDQTLRTG